MSIELQNFINPYISYHGKITPTEIFLNANLQEFGNSVQILINLNTAGKLTIGQTYEKVKILSELLMSSYAEAEVNKDDG